MGCSKSGLEVPPVLRFFLVRKQFNWVLFIATYFTHQITHFFWTRSLKKCDLIGAFCLFPYRTKLPGTLLLWWSFQFLSTPWKRFWQRSLILFSSNMNYFRTPPTRGLPPSLSHVHDFPLTWPVVWPRDQAAIILVNSKQHKSPHGYIGRGFRWKVRIKWHDKPYFIGCNPISRQSR